MSSHSGTWKKTVFTYGIILLGSGILSFGLYNIHERTNVTEGGVLGMTLLLQHWFGFSPSVTSPLMDIACYLLAWRFLGNAFARYALAASLAFAASHALWEQFQPLLPDLSTFPMAAAILGDQHRVLPVSVMLEGEYGKQGVHCGVPCRIGRRGIEEIVVLDLTQQEQQQLDASCQVIRKHIALADSL